jgi:hypothetical protein
MFLNEVRADYLRVKVARRKIREQRTDFFEEFLDGNLQDQSIKPRGKIFLQIRAKKESMRRLRTYSRLLCLPASIPLIIKKFLSPLFCCNHMLVVIT